ncbi:MAG: guanylate cyclase, partial [Planctomycetaceae bacterium]|nr:guanylate cyclase [Planctomycetaceae bacterium]
MEELKNQGATDYVAVPLRFSDGQFHSLTMALDHENGFTTENLGLVFECVGVISRYFEVLTLRNNTTTLLDTYLGKRTGQKVLSGDIRRGQDEDIQAVILFSDLTNSTLLAGELPRNEYL